MINGEAAVLRPANDTVLIDQKAVRHHAEPELNAGYPPLIDRDREACASTLDERPRGLCSGVLERDSDELEATARVPLIELLPPGQLLATPSP